MDLQLLEKLVAPRDLSISIIELRYQVWYIRVYTDELSSVTLRTVSHPHESTVKCAGVNMAALEVHRTDLNTESNSSLLHI